MATITADETPTVAPTLENPDESLGRRIVRVLGHAPVIIVLVVVGVLWLVPTFGLLLTSLLPAQLISSEGWWHVLASPSIATLDNYRAIFSDRAITSALVTTVWISLGGTILPIIIAALAAYAFAWMKFPGRDWFFIGVVAMIVVPLQLALIPVFSLYDQLHLFDTIPGLILFHTAFGLPLAIFLLRNFFVGIPAELLEAARIDGASELRIFTRLVLPLSWPAVASLAIFQFLWTWNDLIVALSLARNTQPITVAIFTQLRQFGANIDVIAPAAFLSLAIPLVVFFAFQRYFVQGLLAGSVK